MCLPCSTLPATAPAVDSKIVRVGSVAMHGIRPSCYILVSHCFMFCNLQVLLSKGVEEGKILFLSLIAAPEGIHRICSTFPRVKLITSEIDEGIGPDYQVVPGRHICKRQHMCMFSAWHTFSAGWLLGALGQPTPLESVPELKTFCCALWLQSITTVIT